MTTPLPLYSFGVDDAEKGIQTAEIPQSGWRGLVVTTDGDQTFADLRVEDGANVAYSKVTRGATVDQYLRSAAVVQATPENEDLELRVIESESLKIAAFWLHGQGDVFVPFEGAEAIPLTEAQFSELISQRAQLVRERWNSVVQLGRPAENGSEGSGGLMAE